MKTKKYSIDDTPEEELNNEFDKELNKDLNDENNFFSKPKSKTPSVVEEMVIIGLPPPSPQLRKPVKNRPTMKRRTISTNKKIDQ